MWRENEGNILISKNNLRRIKTSIQQIWQIQGSTLGLKYKQEQQQQSYFSFLQKDVNIFQNTTALWCFISLNFVITNCKGVANIAEQ